MSITVGNVTLTGQKHINREVPCEDASIAVQENGVSVVVIADGAGSKQYTHARFGSAACVEVISKLFTEHFDAIYNENREAAIRSLIIARIHVAFAQIMQEMELSSLEQLSCTLLFCAIKDRRVIAGHLGDGLIVRVSSDGLSPLTMPQNDLAGHTYFVTANHAPDYLRIVKTTTDNLHAVCLMTDGVQDSVYDENSGLVKPVVARMAETFKDGREKGESEIHSILEKYIVGGSNNSDDSSFGVLYLDDTKAPDSSTLKQGADAFPRSDDSFKKLQEELVPQVKEARAIIVGSAANGTPKSEEPEAENKPEAEAKPEAVEKPAEKEPEKVPEPEATETKSTDTAPKSNKGLFIGIMAAEFVIIVILVIALIMK